jgi:hypothetical protein
MMRTATSIAAFVLALSATTLSAQDRHVHHPDLPKSMRDDHEEIMWALQQAVEQPGAIGAQARELERILRPHFEREEKIALPPLGVIRRLVEIKDVAEMQHWILPITDSLTAELPRMLAEHRSINAARERLAQVARQHNAAAVVAFTDELGRHAQAEEELFYPMAVLVGEVVRARSRTCPHHPDAH